MCVLGTFFVFVLMDVSTGLGVVNNFGSSLCPRIWHAPIVACQKEFQFEGYRDNFKPNFFFSKIYLPMIKVPQLIELFQKYE